MSRRVYVFGGDAPSGSLESAAFLTLINEDCPIQFDAYDGHPYCVSSLFPVAVGDLDLDGAGDVLAQGAYASATSAIADVVVVHGGASVTVDLGGGTDGLVRFSAGSGEWEIPGAGEVRPLGCFAQDFDENGSIDLFLPYYDEVVGSQLLGVRGPID